MTFGRMHHPTIEGGHEPPLQSAGAMVRRLGAPL
jgi:hypothetical protein